MGHPMTSALLGVYMTIMAGPVVPVPLPPDFTARVREVTVTESDRAPSVFTITFDAGRSGPRAAFDIPLLLDSPVAPNARVDVVLTMGAVPQVLIDGIVTQTVLVPGSGVREAALRVTGQDVSALLDRHERSAEHPALSDDLQVERIARPYQTQGIVTQVVSPPMLDPPMPMQRIPTQQDTDWRHLQSLAHYHGYSCFLIPAPTPAMSTLYWGPPLRAGLPQPALSVDLGPSTNVTGPLQFDNDVLGPEFVEGRVPGAGTETIPIRTVGSLRPPLAAEPVWGLRPSNVRVRQFRDTGVSPTTAAARAQAMTDRSVDCVTATGTLDGSTYGSVLRPRGLTSFASAVARRLTLAVRLSAQLPGPMAAS